MQSLYLVTYTNNFGLNKWMAKIFLNKAISIFILI